jgi:hypothetical protein
MRERGSRLQVQVLGGPTAGGIERRNSFKLRFGTTFTTLSTSNIPAAAML